MGILALICALCVCLAACGQMPQEGTAGQESEAGRLKVVCSVYPVYDFTQKIAGDLANVSLLVPPGVEAHDWEPSPADIVQLEEADVLVLNGAGLEFWSEKVLAAIENKDLVIVDSSAQVTLRSATGDGEEQDHEDHDHEEHGHGEYDPHVWLYPMNAQRQMLTITEALVLADPENNAGYQENYAAYEKECALLDEEYRAALSAVPRRSIIVAHEAYGYLCDAYDLIQIGVEGLQPDSEPDPARMAEIVDLMKETGIDTVFYETGASPKVAEAISRETGARVDALNPIEGLSRDDMEAGKNYFTEMRENLQKLVKALSE